LGRYSYILSIISMPSHVIDALAVDARGWARVVDAVARLVAALKVNVFDVEGCRVREFAISTMFIQVKNMFRVSGRTVDVAWEVTKNGQQNVDEEIWSAACDEEYAYGREEDRYDDEEDCGDHIVGTCAAFFSIVIACRSSFAFVLPGACRSSVTALRLDYVFRSRDSEDLRSRGSTYGTKAV
jgi:hypothetical protein